MPNFYTYQNPNPSALNEGNQGHWEDPADWPRTFLYVSAHEGAQGIHPPAPVYQSNQPAQQNMYYFAGSSSAPAGYYANGIYYGTTPPAAAPGWPYTSPSSYTCYPLPSSSPASLPPYNFNSMYSYSPYCTAPQAMPMPIPMPAPSPWAQPPGPAQAAAAVAANAVLAQMPNAPAYFVGATAAEIQAQNAIMYANLAASQQQPPSQLAPYKPGASPQFWCKELDGSWTLREYNDALKADFPAGHWEKHATSGYYYYVRHAG
ncbi:hypothetical protein HRR83_005551 [Exophiala dermatitidis]|uniref:Uncharacterized protein n=1 Tax=Exophiala dermatitidis TaxID=5970 RepID=A0AAN6EMP1_EXODE|nr:hypothetical protein HRR75_008436 [Exophiala dermatitidis]KAJ4503782.1 hypothetical protein HRR74_009173 [Exophiala dermatitidis]KAJ4508177.1 hypothetical protein HRR73_007616 [Exophiala dermatitidis]KAJ4531899.1 hypothetical protein HRR77_009030 [Exophiala dermatitidis]KAJ4537871.1 hypothetical protein HRR78_008463 [Exophiala dermatitidis]